MPNPEIKSNPLDELESRIKSNADVVTRSDVERAYKDAENQIIRQFEGMTDPAAEAVKEKQLQRIREMRDKQIKELDEIKSTRSTGGSKVIAEARLLLADVQSYTANKDKRHGDRERAYTAAGNKAGQIDDYQDLDFKHNATRDIFTGYLAAYESYDPGKAGEELAKAKGVYDKSNPGWLDLDKVLKKDEMMTGLDMTKYAALFDGYDLTDEGKGLMIGYMSVADKMFKTPKEKDDYKAYVIDLMKALQDSGKLKPDAYLESSKREAQRVTLEVVMNPKEWQESNALKDSMKTRATFRSLKEAVKNLKDALGYVPGDASITALLDKKEDDLTAADEAAVTGALDKVKAESGAMLAAKVKEAKDKVAAHKTKLQEITNKNSTANKITKPDLENVSEGIKKAEADLAAVVLTAAATDAIVVQATKYTEANAVVEQVAVILDRMDKTLVAAMVIATEEGPKLTGGTGIGGGRTGAGRGAETGTGAGGAAHAAGAETGGGAETAAGGAGRAAGAETGGGAETETDVYRNGWIKAETVDSGFSGGMLKIAPGVAEAVYRDKDGAVIGKIPGGTDVKMAESKGKKINNTTFIGVLYKGETVWVDKAQLTVSDTAETEGNDLDINGKKVSVVVIKLPRQNEISGTKEGLPAAGIDPDVKDILGTEWPILDYAEGFNAAAKYIKNPEQFKDGVTFNMPFNNLKVGCSLKYENGTSGKVIFVPNIDPRPKYPFDSPKKFMSDLNAGYITAWMTEKVLSSKENYGAYSGLVGKTDFVEKGKFSEQGDTWPIHAEFDWEGGLDDPDVYLRAMPFGQIKFAIQWQHIGADGNNWRVGYANSIEDFFKIMKHYRDWGNRFGDLTDDNRNREMNKEMLYDRICNPYEYNNMGGRIGNVVKFSTSVDKRVDMVLDWGGGQDAESSENARLAVWVGTDGMIHYSVENTGLSNVDTIGTALSPQEVVNQVEAIRASAGKGPAPKPVMVMAR